MRKGMALAAALLSIFVIGSTARAADLAYFMDPSFVDVDQEGAVLDSTLAVDLGHSLTRIVTADSAAWADGLAGAEALVLPELGGTITGISAGAKEVIRDFVRGGGGLVVNYTTGNVLGLLTELFGFPAGTAGTQSPANLSTSAALGTPFVDGPPALSDANDVNPLTNGSLPSGARNIYNAGGSCMVYATTAGSGRVVWTGFDWFQEPAPSDWVSVMGLAVQWVTDKPNAGQTVAVFADPTYIDVTQPAPGTSEGNNMIRLAGLLGHTPTPFTGTTTGEWGTALAGADAIIIPEIEGPSLIDDLDSGAQEELRSFVAGGGTLVTCYTGGNMIGLLNTVFGYSIAATGGTTTNRSFTPAQGSLFQTGPQTLSTPSATAAVQSGSLPAGAVTIYLSATQVSLFAVDFGGGRIYFLGHDYFLSSGDHPVDWQNVLALSLLERPARGVFPTAAVPRGAPATLTISVEDETGGTAGAISWRRAGSTAFTSTSMTDNGDGTFSVDIPPADLTDTGVQYFVELTDGLTTSTQPGGPDGGIFASLPVQVTNFPFANLPAEGFQLRGVPVQPANSNPEAVFDELGGYNRSRWRYGVFNAPAGGYQEPDTGAPPAAPGQGFWIISRDAANIAISGQSSDVSGTLTQTLQPGFNQIANPYAFDIDADDVVMPSTVEFNFIGFENGGYVNNNTTLEVGDGYWLNNTDSNPVEIRFPALGAGVAAAPGLRSDSPARPGPIALAEDESGWSVHVASTVGSAFDRDQRFGMRAGATDEKDAYDFSDAPAPPSDYVNVSLVSRDGTALLTDWRAEDTDGASWDVVLRSDRIGETWNLTFDVERELPDGWSLVAFSGAGAEAVDLLAAPVLSGEVTSEAFQQTWTVVAGESDYVNSIRESLGSDLTVFAFSAPRPNPLRGLRSATMDFQIPRAADAAVEVFDLQGRRVKTLLRGPVERGEHRVVWDGTNAAGSPVAAGVYFVKARAADFSQTRKVTYLR